MLPVLVKEATDEQSEEREVSCCQLVASHKASADLTNLGINQGKPIRNQADDFLNLLCGRVRVLEEGGHDLGLGKCVSHRLAIPKTKVSVFEGVGVAIAVQSSKAEQNRLRLVVGNAVVVDINWDLSGRELAFRLHQVELRESDSHIFEWNLGVMQQHADAFSASTKVKINQFWH